MTIEINADRSLFWLYCDGCGVAAPVTGQTPLQAVASAQRRGWTSSGPLGADYHLCPACRAGRGLDRGTGK